MKGKRQDLTPTFIYGTAWKEDATEELTRLAIDTGFRAIDTANQRRHYFEAGVGAAVASAIEEGVITRDDVFLQTKFTYADSQDHRLPYDPDADAATQVAQSFASSLDHLRTDFIDSYLLHGPSQHHGLGAVDLEVWRAMEDIHDAGRVRHLGISNVGLDQLEQLSDSARVRPAFVQNRCYARLGWDRDIRDFCNRNSIIYQGFSLLTANVRELGRPEFRRIMARTGRTPAQIVFRFALQAGMIPLTGTTDENHMHEDLGALDFVLEDEDVRLIESI